MEDIQLSEIVKMEDPNPKSVFNKVSEIVKEMCPEFRFENLRYVFGDIVDIFNGQYPGYRKCNTNYHDLKHTTGTFLVMARLMHGLSLKGKKFNEKDINFGLICSLMHDTGFIQTFGDDEGTGAKYVKVDTERSIKFMNKYLTNNEFLKQYLRNGVLRDCAKILNCTAPDKKPSEIKFGFRKNKLLGKMLGTADLLGQMSDRTYLEKLLFLYPEFVEGGVGGYESELDLLKKTITNFYPMVKKRLANELDNINEYMRYHFKAKRNIDRDLYMEAIEKNINYLNFILENHEKDYRSYLRRGFEKKGILSFFRNKLIDYRIHKYYKKI